MKGKATVLVKPNHIEIWDVPIADPEPGGTVVRTLIGGVCGSDVHIANGDAGEMPFPIILGHEGVGRIEKLGAGVDKDYAGVDIKVGDLVVWSPIPLCGRCYSCTVLNQTPCENTQYFEHAEKPNWGTYSEFSWLPRGLAFFKLPDGADPVAIGALGCALPTVLRGFDRCGPIALNDAVVVQGAGPVGLSAVLVASQMGARSVTVIDNSPARLDAARKLGATSIVSLDLPIEERRRAVADVTGPQGADVVIECAGVLPAFPEGIDLTGPHGRYIVLGLWGAIGTQPISPRDLTTKNLTIGGAAFPAPRNYYHAMHLAARLQDKVPLAELVSHRFAIADSEKALAVTASGEATKAIIDPTLS